MNDTQIYTQILGISKPRKFMSVDVSLADSQVEVHVKHNGSKLRCLQFNKVCPGYDNHPRRWRHLDTCQPKTVLVADVLGVECSEHGVVTVSVPWAESANVFTALFEALEIEWLKEASIRAVAGQFRLSWNAVDGIM